MSLDGENRRLTTILASDVVGYSNHMAVDEEAAMATLRTYRKIVEALISKHDGRVFNTAGDAILAEFSSAVEAVRCAISIQEDLRVRNSELAEDRQMWLRIGINVGDVMIDGGDLFGDGVNVAARLEGLAEKGGICISGSTFDQVKNKMSIAFNGIGDQLVKNIPYPIPAYQLAAGKVAVDENANSRSSQMRPAGARSARRWSIFLGGTVIAIIIGAVIAWGLYPSETNPVAIEADPANPFDGRWNVTVTSMSGCRENGDRTFSINVVSGTINEQRNRNLITGTVTAGGEFNIAASNRGVRAGTMVGTIDDDTGGGTFQGRVSTCSGTVGLVRSN